MEFLSNNAGLIMALIAGLFIVLAILNDINNGDHTQNI